jgi:hypothetical protein
MLLIVSLLYLFRLVDVNVSVLVLVSILSGSLRQTSYLTEHLFHFGSCLDRVIKCVG